MKIAQCLCLATGLVLALNRPSDGKSLIVVAHKLDGGGAGGAAGILVAVRRQRSHRSHGTNGAAGHGSVPGTQSNGRQL